MNLPVSTFEDQFWRYLKHLQYILQNGTYTRKPSPVEFDDIEPKSCVEDMLLHLIRATRLPMQRNTVFTDAAVQAWYTHWMCQGGLSPFAICASHMDASRKVSCVLPYSAVTDARDWLRLAPLLCLYMDVDHPSLTLDVAGWSYQLQALIYNNTDQNMGVMCKHGQSWIHIDCYGNTEEIGPRPNFLSNIKLAVYDRQTGRVES